MDASYKKRLENNLRRYAWSKTFTKRVYFPILTVMLISVAHLSYDQIALIAIVASIVQGVLQIPTGYFADKLGDKRMVVLGSLIMLPSTLFYIFMPNFLGALLGLVSFAAAFAFIGGAIESFIHDTLLALGKAHEYTKVVGRAQSLGLIGNVVLVSLTPLTYAIDYRLPFVVGFFCTVALVLLMVAMVSPPPRESRSKANPLEAMRRVVTWQNLALFLFAGFMAGILERGSDFVTLMFQGVGVPDYLFGVVVAASSIVGAVLGWYLFIFDRLKPVHFYLFDVIFIALSFYVMGSTQSAWVVLGMYVLFMGYSRVRYIVMQSKLLEDIQHTYKATLLSALSFFNLFGGMLAVTIVAKFVNHYGVFTGHVYFAGAIAAIGLLLCGFILLTLHASDVRREARIKSALD